MEYKKTNKFRIEITRRHVPLIDYPYRWELKQKLVRKVDGEVQVYWAYVDSGLTFTERGARRASEKQLHRQKYYPDEKIFEKEYDRDTKA